LPRARCLAALSSLFLPARARDKPPPSTKNKKKQKKQAVCFDVDSTFCEDESIDEIAAYLGVGDAVAALTARAMGGAVPFQDALAARLDLMRPSRARLDAFLAERPARLSPGIPKLVGALQRAGKGVFLVSGGFRAVIHPIAESLGIPEENVYANTILFDVSFSFPPVFPGSAPGRRPPSPRSLARPLSLSSLSHRRLFHLLDSLPPPP